MGRVGFSDLKIKVMGGASSISAVERVKAFANVDRVGSQPPSRPLDTHGTLVVSGVLFAVTNRITIEAVTDP